MQTAHDLAAIITIGALYLALLFGVSSLGPSIADLKARVQMAGLGEIA